MSQCEKCDAFDEDHAEYLDYPEGLSEEEEIEWLENHQDYEPSLYFYWHGDIQEDYAMGEYTCLCESCFGTLLNQGKIKTTEDRDWNCEIHGWGNPDGWDNEPSKLSQQCRIIIMNEQRANEELNIELEYERVKEQRYKAFQEWLNDCPLVVTDYQDYTNEFVITFNLEAD